MKNVLAIVLWLVCTLSTFAQTSAFTYQGRLNNNTSAANGFYDLRFTVYDALTNGTAISAVITKTAIPVSNGLFTAELDFGTNVFSGTPCWLQIAVQTNGAGNSFITLNPRQQITSAPYAIRATAASSVTGSVPASLLTGTISANNIAGNSIDASKLAPGSVTSSEIAAEAVTTSAISDGAVTASKLETTYGIARTATFVNPTPSANAHFGTAAAFAANDRILIGSIAEKAFLFSTNGTLLSTLNNPTTGDDDFGVAVAGSDNVLVVGAPWNDTSALKAGSVYLYSTTGAFIQAINNPAAGHNDFFGNAVAVVSANRILAGAYEDDLGGVDAGSAYLFSTNGTLITTFTNPAPSSANFGQSVAAIGSTKVLIGSPNSDAAYIFSTNGTLLNTLTSGSPGGGFGFQVAAFAEGKVLISAPYSGMVYLMSTNGTQIKTFINFEGQFGNTLAAVGADKVLIGASGSSGKAYLYHTNGTLLSEITDPGTGTGLFGSAVAAMGEKLFVGAKNESSVGVAYLFSPHTYATGVISEGVRPGGVTREMLAQGAVDSSAILDGTIVNADIAPNAAIADTKLATVSTSGKVSNTATTATSANTANAIVARDSSGNFSAGTITANGSALTSLNASSLSSGTVADARLSSNVARLTGSPVFDSTVRFNDPVQIWGGLRLNDTNIWLRSNTDVNHGLGWYGGGKPFANASPDGPILFGWSGGALGSVNGGQKIALSWDNAERVGIGMTNPVAQLHVSGPGNNSNPQAWLNQETSSDYVRLRMTVNNDTAGRWDIGATPSSFNIYSGLIGSDLLVLNNAGLTVRGTFVSSSDRDAKDNVAPINAREILDKVAALPISEWSYKDSPESRHVGPMAQDFHAAFAVGTDNKHISMVDADGVALAAIQALNQKVDEQKRELSAKDKELQQVQRRLAELEELVRRLSK